MGANLIKKNANGFNYKYTDLAQIHKLLDENGISYYQYIETVDGSDYIMTVPIVDDKELPARRGCRVAQATLKGVSNPAQEQGSAITYARRYSLLMAFGLATTDDDAACMSVKLASDKDKDNFRVMCKKLGVSASDILVQAGWDKSSGVSEELLDKALMVAKEISESK